MKILLTGTADKRPIVYPLLYTLNFLGSTALITADTQYRRLLTNCDASGEIHNVGINTIISALGNEIFDIGERFHRLSGFYEHFVIISFGDISIPYFITDCKIRVIRDGETVIADDADNTDSTGGADSEKSETETKADTYIRVGYSAKKENENFIPLTETLYKQLYNMEINSRLEPLRESQNNKTLSKVFAPAFGKTEKEMRKLLTYKGGKRT